MLQKHHEKHPLPINVLCSALLALLSILLVGGAYTDVALTHHQLSQNTGNGTAAMPMSGSSMPTSINMGSAPVGTGVPVTNLQAPQTAAQVDHFTLSAQSAHLTLAPGNTVDAWTYNSTIPGPTLHVHQGDLVVVQFINHLSIGTTIHWHGIAVPASMDGVAGVTQNAVQPGQSFTYRFLAKDAGTYWYHSHQQSYEETTRGLYGMLIVVPATPTYHDDVDMAVALHEWTGANNQTLLTMNETTQQLSVSAKAGQWVRLRVVNTASNQQVVTLLGTPFTVVALDGHDLKAPTPLTRIPLPIGAAQRYDLRFQMPSSGTVALLTEGINGQWQQSPVTLVGQVGHMHLPASLPVVGQNMFDLSTYGQPVAHELTMQSHFDVNYTITLNMQMGTSLGRMGMTYTLDGKVFPNTPTITVKMGQLVHFHLVNESTLIHPMHLHGHTFIVLTRDGRPVTGSPVSLDTINIQPHETYDIAFYANNPGIWMFHCHNLYHANWGMDMMVVYQNISTPYTIGTASGNLPD